MENRFEINQNVKEDAKEKKSFLKFINEHKKEITFGAVAVCAIVAGVVICRNRVTINNLEIEDVIENEIKTHRDLIPVASEVAVKSISGNLPSGKIINVNEHLRNLPDSWNPSQNKVALAALHGYTLEEHQTWVNSYAKVVA